MAKRYLNKTFSVHNAFFTLFLNKCIMRFFFDICTAYVEYIARTTFFKIKTLFSINWTIIQPLYSFNKSAFATLL